MKAPLECLARWEMHRHLSILSEQRERGPHRDDFWQRIEARDVAPTDTPVQVLQGFTLEGTPVLWFDAALRDLVVDARFSSSLDVVDATNLAPGARRVLGNLTPAAARLPAETIVELLVRADVIRTWAHMESSMCLEHLESSGASWRARVRGEHVYFTNREHRAPFAFEVTCDGAGILEVVGVP